MRDAIRSMMITKFGLHSDVDDAASLFSSGLLDSLMAVQLLVELEDEFGVKLSPLDVSLDDVDTIDAVVATVDRFS